MLNLVLCFVVYTCFVFDCISAVLRDRSWFCCSVMTATIISEDYYYYYYIHCSNGDEVYSIITGTGMAVCSNTTGNWPYNHLRVNFVPFDWMEFFSFMHCD